MTDEELVGWGSPEDPTKDHYEEGSHGVRYFWSGRARRWYKIERVYKIKSRKFLGTFGDSRLRELFCEPLCGAYWAIEFIQTGVVPGTPPNTR